jgi:hypothetical protein
VSAFMTQQIAVSFTYHVTIAEHSTPEQLLSLGPYCTPTAHTAWRRYSTRKPEAPLCLSGTKRGREVCLRHVVIRAVCRANCATVPGFTTVSTASCAKLVRQAGPGSLQ